MQNPGFPVFSKKLKFLLLVSSSFLIMSLVLFQKQRRFSSFLRESVFQKAESSFFEHQDSLSLTSVHISHPSEDIISLSPHFTQMVIDLGRQDALVALSEGMNHPAEVGHLPRVKFPTQNNLADLLKWQPGAILGLPSFIKLDSNGSDAQHQGIDSVATISTQNLYSFEDVFSLFRRVNIILDHNTLSANSLIEEKKQKLASLLTQTQALPKPSVAFIYPLTNEKQEIVSFSVVGKGTPEQDALHFAGGQNAFPQVAGYETISFSAFTLANPDWLVVHPSALVSLSKQLALQPWFQNNHVLAMDTSAFVSSRLEEATLQLARQIHPKEMLTFFPASKETQIPSM